LSPGKFQEVLADVLVNEEFPTLDPGLIEGAAPLKQPAHDEGMFWKFGECVVRASPAHAHELLMTKINSAEEVAAFQKLAPNFAQCPGLDSRFSSQMDRRGTIAINFYRLAHCRRGRLDSDCDLDRPPALRKDAIAITTNAPNQSGEAARTLFSIDDYPVEAVKNRWEGAVVADLTISPEGHVSACAIVQSSGHGVLDQATCDIMKKRAMFKPATDATGKPVEDHVRTPPVVWALSNFGTPTGFTSSMLVNSDGTSRDARTLFSVDDYPIEAVKNGWEGTVLADLTISPEGRVSSCAIIQSSGHAVLDQATCDIITKRAVFTPAKDASGKPVEDHVRTPPVVWGLSNPAIAAVSLPTHWQQLAPGHLLCSESVGHADVYAIPSLEPGKPIKFAIKLVSDNYDPTFGANAALIFNAPSGEARFQVGKSLGERYLFVGLHGGGSDPDNWVMLEPFADPDRWFNVKMELDTAGVVRIVTENAKGSIRLGTSQPVQTLLQCNSGVFEVEMSPTSSVEHALRP
jgi:TonB family protein